MAIARRSDQRRVHVADDGDRVRCQLGGRTKVSHGFGRILPAEGVFGGHSRPVGAVRTHQNVSHPCSRSEADHRNDPGAAARSHHNHHAL